MVGLILFICIFICLLIGFPIVWTIGGVATLFMIFFSDFLTRDFGFSLPWEHVFSSLRLFFVPQRIFGNIMSNYTLIAVPFFVFMGEMFEKSGMANSLLENMGKLLGNRRGGLGLSVVLVGTLLAAATGIVGATVIIMGLIALPSMLKAGYKNSVVAGVICASATLGQIIPPSVVLVILADQIAVSVGDLFVAAVIPGLLLSCGYMIWVIIYSRIDGTSMPPLIEVGDFSWLELLRSFLPPVFLVITVLASIFFGFATPTEAGACGAFGALLLALIARKLSWTSLVASCSETVTFTSMVFMILYAASFFGIIFHSLGGGHWVRDVLTQIPGGSYMFLFVTLMTMFILGFFIDFLEIIFIVLPIVAPIAIQSFGFDPLWYSILVALVVQTSFLTPPFGFALFYLKGVAPQSITLNDIYRGVIPFIVVQLIVILLVVFFPQLVSFLPSIRPQYSY